MSRYGALHLSSHLRGRNIVKDKLELTVEQYYLGHPSSFFLFMHSLDYLNIARFKHHFTMLEIQVVLGMFGTRI
jgi:hypothetical protein